MYGFAPVFCVATLLSLSVNALAALFLVLVSLLFSCQVEERAVGCRVLLLDHVACFVLFIPIYGIFRVCPLMGVYTGLMHKSFFRLRKCIT